MDAIHAETYKVLTGLGRSGEKSKADEDGNLESICRAKCTFINMIIFKKKNL